MSVLANEVSEAQFKTTLAKLNDINMETLLGNYFVIPDVGALVHKYVLRVNNEDAKSTAEDLYACLGEVVAQVNNDYDRVVASIAE